MRNEHWFVYILRCSDNTFYCGIAKDVQNRLMQHNQGKGAKFTRGRAPCHVVWQHKEALPQGDALRLERKIKKMSRFEKEKLIEKVEL